MDNKEIEVLDDFDFDDASVQNVETEQMPVLDSQDQNFVENKEVTPMEPVTSEEKKDQENPVIEMINNKTTMKLIVIMLVVLFIAVFLMPKVFELIGTI